MKHALIALAAMVGASLVLAVGIVLTDDRGSSIDLVAQERSAKPMRPVEVAAEGSVVRVTNPLLVVNEDGSAAVGAVVQNVTGPEVSLMGVVVAVDGRRRPVNSTEMWLPVPAGERARVGAASDAGGFVVPDGIEPGTRAELEFRFDDGTCVAAELDAEARTDEHRSVYPKTRKAIGPVTSADPPEGTTCGDEQSS